MADDIFRVEVGAKISTSTTRLRTDIQKILNDISAKSAPTITVSLDAAKTKRRLEKSLNSIVSGLKIDLSNITVSGTFKGNLSDLSKDIKNIEKASKSAGSGMSSFYSVLSKDKLDAIGQKAQKAAAQLTTMGEAYKALNAQSSGAAATQSPSIIRQGLAITAAQEQKATAEAAAYFKQAEAEKAAAAASAASSIEKSYKQSIANITSFYGHSDVDWWKESLTGGEAAYKRAINQANRLSSAFNQNSEVGRKYADQLQKIQSRYKDLPLYGRQYEEAVKNLGKEAKEAGAMAETASQKFSRMLGTRVGYTVIATGLFAIRSAMRDLYQNVVDLDAAMTELKKVTDETDETYMRFLEDAADRSQKLGAKLIDTVNATADFARLGYNLTEASELADAALVYKNVGDGIADINEASESVIATMQAFQLEASYAMNVVDKFNEVGNNFAISSKGVGDALLRSAAAMSAANNTLDETIALATAANTVVQDPEKVGTTLKTLSMYLRAAKTEAEEAGESTEGMANSVSELRDEILSLTGDQVDIMIDDNTFKSSYQILKEISQVWDQLTDVSQANILEMLGGKRNANIVAALVENFDIAENALETSLNSAGSALSENEKVLESVAGKMNLLSAAYEQLSNDVLDSDIIKAFVDSLRVIITLFNDLDDLTGGLSSNLLLIVTTVGLVTAIFGAFKVQIAGAGTAFVGLLTKLKTGTVLTSLSAALKAVVAQISAFTSGTAAAAGSTTLAAGAMGGLSMATLGWIGIAATAVIGGMKLYQLYQEMNVSLEELQERYHESTAAVTELTNELDTNATRIRELQELYNKGEITLAEESELKSLKQKNDLLESQLSLKQAQNDADLKALQIRAREQASEYMEDTAGITTDSWGVQTDVRSEKEKLEDQIQQYKDTQKQLMDAYDRGDEALATKLENSLADTLSQLSEMSLPLGDYLSILDPIEDRELIKEIELLSAKVQLTVGDAEDAQEAIADLLSTSSYSGAVQSLSELANQGTLTADTLKTLSSENPEVKELVDALEYLGVLDWDNIDSLQNQLKDIADAATEVSFGFSEIYDSLDSLTSKYELLDKLQEEYSENGSITLDTLQELAELYPELEQDIALYLVGLKSEKDLIASMSEAYNIDVQNYKQSIAEKLMSSPEFYESLSQSQKQYIDDLAAGYGVDLQNFKDLETAKLKFQAEIIKKLAANNLKLIGSQITMFDVSNAAYNWKTATDPEEAARYEAEFNEIRDAYLAIKQFEASLNDIVTNGVPYDPASYSPKSTSSSSSTDKYKEQVEEKIDLLKHQLNMNLITEQEYYDQLEAIENKYYKNSQANMQKYAEEIRSIDEELFSGRRELFSDWLSDQEFHLEAMQGSGDLAGQERLYTDILNKILEQIKKSYDYGLDENSDYIQELKSQYREYANSFVEETKNAYDEIESYLDNFDLWDDYGLSKSDWYGFRLDELKKQYDQGLLYWEDYVSSYNEIAKNLYDVQKESIESIIEMTMDMIKQEADDKVSALEDQIDAYSKIIEQKKELLQKGDEEQDQEEQIKEKVSEIAKLQSKIAQLSLDDSREANAQKAQLEEELAQLQKELADLQGDYALDATIDSLDKQQSAFEDEKQGEIDIIEESVDSWAKLYQIAIERINGDWDGLYQDLMDYQLEYRDSIDGPDSLKTAWENASSAMQDYFDKYGSSNVEDVLGGLGGSGSISSNVPNASQASSIISQMYQNSIKALQSPSMASSLNAQNKKLAEQYKALTGQNLVQDSSNVWRLDNTTGQSVYEKYGFSENETIMGPNARSNPYEEGTASYNSTGDAVKWIQYQLQKGLGYANQTITGQYGPVTLENVKKFQATHGLSATGNVDSKTLKYLRAYHTGGIVDGTGAINDHEVLAILEKNEMVLDDGKKYNLRTLFNTLRTSLSQRFLSPSMNTMPVIPRGGDTFAPNIEVNIQHTGSMTDADADRYGNQIAQVALEELRTAFVKRGI